MKEEKSSFDTILTTLGQIIGLFIIWFVIGAAWNGIHDWFCRNLLGKVPGEESGEKFGKTVFFLWVLSIIGTFYIIGKVDHELGAEIVFLYLKLTFCFALITLFGLIYFFSSLK
jgi:hypothetical protein